MASSPHQLTAEAVKATLKAEPFSLPFTSVRVYRPYATLAELKTLHVYVMASQGAATRIHRDSGFQFEYQISVGMQQVVDAADVAQLDPLDELHNETIEHLSEAGLMAGSRWVSYLYEPLRNPENLNENQLYSSVSNHIYQPEA